MSFKANKNGISVDLVSYITHILNPSEDYMKHVPINIKNQMENEYNTLLEHVSRNFTKLLDLVTHDCKDYFVGSAEENFCEKHFKQHYYAIGGKCFPNMGHLKNMHEDFSFSLNASSSRYANLNDEIASADVKVYTNIKFMVLEDVGAFYNTYNDLITLNMGQLTILRIEKITEDHRTMNRIFEHPNCNASLDYSYYECCRYYNHFSHPSF